MWETLSCSQYLGLIHYYKYVSWGARVCVWFGVTVVRNDSCFHGVYSAVGEIHINHMLI